LVPDDTRFAPGSSESAFEQVSPGMPESKVLELLGPPLGTRTYRRTSQYVFFVGGTGLFERDEPSTCEGNEGCEEAGTITRDLHYSAPGERSESFYIRSIAVSEDGVVLAKLAWFYAD
jgi:hypothetical protein